MDLDSLVQAIMEATLGSDVFSADPAVQERIIQSNVYNILEDFHHDLKAELWAQFEAENGRI